MLKKKFEWTQTQQTTPPTTTTNPKTNTGYWCYEYKKTPEKKEKTQPEIDTRKQNICIEKRNQKSKPTGKKMHVNQRANASMKWNYLIRREKGRGKLRNQMYPNKVIKINILEKSNPQK